MDEHPTGFLQRAFTSKWMFWVILIGLLLADLASKAWAEAAIEPLSGEKVVVIDGVLAWKWAVNEGAAFSILEGRPLLLAVIASAVLLAILAYAWRASPKRKWFLAGLALVASGALGNLHDRIRLGHVRDFMFFDFELPWHERFGFIPQYWPVFNVADMAILAGVGILMVISFKGEPKPEPKPEPDDPGAPEPTAEIVSEVIDDEAETVPRRQQEGDDGP